MSTRATASERATLNRTVVGLVSIVAAVAVVFVLGWVLGTQSGPAIESSIEYPQAETPRERYAINIEVDPTFYSFYDEFESNERPSSVAGLR